MLTTHAHAPTGALLMAITLVLGCEKPKATPKPVPSSLDDSEASRPRPGPAPRIAVECLDMYAECEPIRGLPAISLDGTRVAVADTGPDTERDERVLTVRIVEVSSGAELAATVISSYEDYDRAANPLSGELSGDVRAELSRRARALEQELERGGFAPLTALGVVHEQRRQGQEISGLRAAYDGQQLTITDVQSGTVRWQRPIGPLAAYDRGDGETCGPFPVADIAVWASQPHGVAVAQIRYIGSDLCVTEKPYVVWR